jgi:hypothetical protein
LRWPLAPLLEAAGNYTGLVAQLGVAGSEYTIAREKGCTDRQADSWAIRLGFHPSQIWPEWDRAGLSVLDDEFVNHEGWRPAWEWAQPSVALRNAPCYTHTMFTNPHGMHLITKAQAAKIPRLRAQDGKGAEAVAHVRLFHPLSRWTWYVLELDPTTGEAFGIVEGDDTEYGYFDMNEMAAMKVGGLGVERDSWFAPMTLREAVTSGLITRPGRFLGDMVAESEAV